MNDNCTNCKYTVSKEGGSLTCQRHPQPVRVARSYWCGEWRPDVKVEKQDGKANKQSGSYRLSRD